MKKNFPINYSILSSEALASSVLPGFNIGEIFECSFYSGGFNDTYIVKTVQGSTYYLRAYRKSWRSLEDILYELDVLNHLKCKDFPAARPVQYKDGNFYCALSAPEGERYLAVFTEASGPEISYEVETEKIAHQYGRAVAMMHNALDDFSSQHKRFIKDLDYLIDTPLGNIKTFLAHRPKDWRTLQYFASKVRHHIDQLPASALEMGFCHGDLQGYHANVAPDGTFTFFDFDCGGYGFRSYDLAVFLWCCRLENAVEKRWKPYLSGYQEVRTLNQLDIEAIPAFVCARYIWHMGVHTQNAPDWGCGWLNDNYFDQRLAQLQKVEADYLND